MDDAYAAQNIEDRAYDLPPYNSESHYSSDGDDGDLNCDRVPRELTTPAYQAICASDSPVPGISSRVEHYWRPFWLRAPTLLSIALLYGGLMAGLILICRHANSLGGFRTTSPHYYLWLCVPTMLFVVVSSAWHQVDYHVRTLMPWKELREGPTRVSNSLLIDYTSSVDAVALLRALKRLHIPVVAAITGSYVTKIILLASTALFVTRTVNITNQYPAVAAPVLNVAAVKASGSDPNPSGLRTALYTYYQQKLRNLGPQAGLATGYAYELLKIPTLSDFDVAGGKMIYTGDTNAFLPLITCQLVEVDPSGLAPVSTSLAYNSTSSPYGRLPNVTLALSEPGVCAGLQRVSLPALDPVHYLVPPYQVQASVRKLQCNGTVTQDSAAGILLAITNISYTQTLLRNVSRVAGGSLPIALKTTRRIQNHTAVLCQPSYSIGTAILTNDTSLSSNLGVSTSLALKEQNETLSGLSRDDMSDILLALLSLDSGLLSDSRTQGNRSLTLRSNAFDIFQLFAGVPGYNDLFDADTLSAAVMDVYLGVLPVLIMQSSAASPSSTVDTHRVANVTWQEVRLCAEWVILSVLVSGLGFLVLVLVSLIFIGPHTVVPRNPNSIATVGTILARSTELNKILQNEYTDTTTPSRLLEDYRVSSAVAIDKDESKSFRILAIPDGLEQRQRQRQEIRALTYWNPVSSKLRCLFSTICLLLVLIAALEVLQHFSDTRSGLLDAPASSVTLYSARLVPAFVLVSIAGIIGHLASHIILFAPWSAMHVGNVTARSSVLLHFLDSIAPLAAFRAIKLRFWNVLAATLAILLSALLVVVSPTLYRVQTYGLRGPSRSLRAVDVFDLNRLPVLNNDRGAAAALNLILHNVTGFPPGTWDELAFAGLSLDPAEAAQGGRSVRTSGLTATIPARRADLECHVLDQVNTTVLGSRARVISHYKVSANCLPKADNARTSEVKFVMDLMLSQKETTYVGRQFDFDLTPDISSYELLGGAEVVSNSGSTSECPSLLFVWGSLSIDAARSADISAMACYQQLHKLSANVTLVRNSTVIDSRHPPQVTEASAILLDNPNSTANGTSFDFRIQNNLERQLGTYDSTDEYRVAPNANFDTFFQAVLNGTSPYLVPQELFSNRTATIARIRRIYRLYMAQVLSSNMRAPTPETNLTGNQSLAVYYGTTTVFVPRLIQNRASKTILQVLIAILIALLAFAWANTKMRNILPHNPSTIAGVMSLLAGSELCRSSDDRLCSCCGRLRRTDVGFVDRSGFGDQMDNNDQYYTLGADAVVIKSGTEWMSDAHFARVFDDHLYSLGRWADSKHGSRKTRYGVDIVGAKSTKVFGQTPNTSNWYLNRKRADSSLDSSGESAILSGALQVPPRGRSWVPSDVDVNERGRYAHVRDMPQEREGFRNRPGFVGGGSPQPETSL